MLTEASQRALQGLRDPTTLEWYVIPLLALVFYVYAREIAEARRTKSWDAIFAGATLFGMDFVNETANGWILNLTHRSALWTAPGPTALRVLVGWNLEIIFMFAIAGLIFFHTISPDPKTRILGLPDRWFWAIAYSAFCVLVELVLNAGGLLVWEYPFWGRSFGGVWLIFLLGYFHFYVAVILVLAMKSTRGRVIAVASIYGVAVVMNVIGMGVMGWKY
ncbi:MAG TPA: hypothetical protein VF316_15525 [Polyangiaceae bacterium]